MCLGPVRWQFLVSMMQSNNTMLCVPVCIATMRDLDYGPKYSLSYRNLLPGTSTGPLLLFCYGVVFFKVPLVVFCSAAPVQNGFLSHSTGFHGGGDWSVNLLHDMFEIFIWGWAVRRCPTHSLLGSRGRPGCQKVIIFARYGSVLIFMDSRLYTFWGSAPEVLLQGA